MIDTLLDDREVAKITGRARSTLLAHKAFGVPDLHLSRRIFRLKPPSAPVREGPGFSKPRTQGSRDCSTIRWGILAPERDRLVGSLA
jgi:hypothetical protein